MATETGTATDYLDLLARLRTFLTATLPAPERWTSLYWEPAHAAFVAYVASASQSNAGPERAFDGFTSTAWAAVDAANEWVGLQFGQPVHVSAFDLTIAAGSAQPRTFALEFSDDGAAWSVWQTYGPLTATDWATRSMSFTTGASSANRHAFWRWRFIDQVGAAAAFLVENITPWEEFTDLRGGRPARLFLRGPGAGTDQIFVNVETEQSVAADWFNWQLNGATGFLAGTRAQAQPGALSSAPRLLLWNAAIPYWFVANGRRAVVVAKVNTTYHAAYLGFILPYATPQQFPYPLAIGGSCAEAGLRWSDSTPRARCFFDPGQNSAAGPSTLRLRAPDGAWLSFANWSSFGGQDSAATERTVWPYHGSSLQQAFYARIRDTLDGGYAMFPLVLAMRTPSRNVFGELEGCYAISGFNNAAENIATWNGKQHLVIPNVFRTAKHQWAAIRLE